MNGTYYSPDTGVFMWFPQCETCGLSYVPENGHECPPTDPKDDKVPT